MLARSRVDAWASTSRPRPYIADQVADALLIWREGGHGGSALTVVLGAVECALPGVVSSSPRANSAPSSPLRATYSYSTSVGSYLLAQVT
jgi:hypothetical protein